MILQIYRNGTASNFVNIDKSTLYTHEVMGVHEIRAQFISQEALDIKVDDYIMFRGSRFNINVEFACQKVSNFEYHYDIVFEAYVYWLKDKIFRHLEAVEFSYFETASAYVSLIVENMNEVDTGWEVGNVDVTEPKGIEFYGEERGFTCKGALMKVAEEFGLEFWLTNKTIHLTRQAGVDTNLDFEYGRGRGLYSVTKGALETPLYNRIYGYGGTKNISSDYRNGAKRLMFEEKGLERALGVGERRRETSVIFDDIFPHRTGTITAVNSDWTRLTDSSLNFDLEGQRVGSEDAKIQFLTGDLAGIEYVIASYDHSTKTITIVPFEEEDGYITPNESRYPSPGDQYTLTGIVMPQSYINTAEAELEAATRDIFNQISRPPYQVEVDPHYMRDNAVTVKAGDRVRLKDTSLGIDDMIRVTSVSFPLVEPDEVTFVISDKIIYTNEVLQEIDKNKIQNDIIVVDRTKAELARRNMLDMRRLQGMIYDPDGYFDTDNIKPNSIETGMLSVGAKSQNYGLNGVAIEANYLGDPNSLRVSGGQLIHFEIEIEGLGYVWELTSQVFESLVPANSYYLYAKCSTSSLSGSWVVSTEPLQADHEAGYYHFWVGILYPVEDGYRGFQFTKGMTFIVGDTITTGRIQSLDGLVFLDLSQGTFYMGDENQSMDWGVTSAGQLTINGALVTKMMFAEDAEIINLIVKNLRTNLTGKRIQILEEDNNLQFFDEDGHLVLLIDDNIDADDTDLPLAGIKALSGSRVSYLSGNGVFSNAGGYRFLSAVLGWETNASVVGILNQRNEEVNGISAGIAGIDNTTSGNSRSYGGFFNSLYTEGLNVHVQITTTSMTIGEKSNCFISCYNVLPIVITLPPSPLPGRIVFVRKNNDFTVTVHGNGNNIFNESQTATQDVLDVWTTGFVIWDGQNWIYNVLSR